MNYKEYQETELVTAMRESLIPVIGKDASNYFLGRVYTEMETQGIDIRTRVSVLTYRAKNGLIADMIYHAIGIDCICGEDKLYWYLMEKVLEANFSNKVLSEVD